MNNVIQLKKQIRNIAIYIIIAHIGFVFFCTCVNFIPGSVIKKNLATSAENITDEGLYTVPFTLNGGIVKWDNWTSSLAFNIISRGDSSHPFKSAALNEIGGYSEMATTPIDAMNDQINGSNFEGNNTYSRYWLGCVAVLKLLLTIFDLNEIRILLSFLSGMMLFYSVWIGNRYKNFNFWLAYFLIYFICGIYINAMCTTYYADIYIAMLAIIFILWVKNKYGVYLFNSIWIFFAIGSLTMFFCWYSYPLLTLNFGLISWLIFADFDVNSNKLKTIIIILVNSVSWCLGYIVTMKIKEIWCRIVNIPATGTDEMKRMIGELTFESIPGRLVVCKIRLAAFFNRPLTTFIIIGILILVICNLYQGIRINIVDFKNICLTFVAFYPLIWIFFTAPHAIIHDIDSYPLITSVFAVYCLINNLLKRPKQPGHETCIIE